MNIHARCYTKAELVGLGEHQFLEFKKSGGLMKEAFADLCAMVNAAGGRGAVVLGVEPTGEVCGLGDSNLDSLQLKLANHANQKLEPKVELSIEAATCEGKSILVIYATRRPTVPFHEYDGRAYIREGSASRALTLAEKNDLALTRDRARHNGPWRCDTCGAYALQVASVVITEHGPRKVYTHRCGGEWWPAT